VKGCSSKSGSGEVTLEDIEACIKLIERAVQQFNKALSVMRRLNTVYGRISTVDDLMKVIMSSAVRGAQPLTEGESELTPEDMERVKKIREKYIK